MSQAYLLVERPPTALSVPMTKAIKLAVQKWNDYLAYRESGTLTEAQEAEQRRVKRL